jgi:hypothetical protein
MVPRHDKSAFFTRDRDAFIPTTIANGPWDPNSLHGRVIIGLLDLRSNSATALTTSCRRG